MKKVRVETAIPIKVNKALKLLARDEDNSSRKEIAKCIVERLIKKGKLAPGRYL